MWLPATQENIKNTFTFSTFSKLSHLLAYFFNSYFDVLEI